MPAAGRNLIGWAVMIYVAAALSVCSNTTTYTCQAPTEYGPENKVTCNVSYTDTLMLECPDPASHKSATWRKAVNERYSVSICNAESPECTLNPNRTLTNQDSGLYFCEIPAANGSDPSRSYVEITALAPPSLRNVVYCAKDNASLCTRQSISAYIWDRFTVTVEFSGIGPFSVQWKHNNSDFGCQKLYYCHERNSTNKMSLQFIANLNPDNATGEYSAIVSNHYGWNVSVTSVSLTNCAPVYNPVSLSHNSTIALMDGANTTLSCKLKADSEYWLTVCYGKYNRSFSDFTNESVNDKYCTFCFPNTSGACKLLPPKPEWAVYRKEGGECGDILENDIVIKDFSKNDEGIIVCFYGDDEVPYHLYTTYTVTYETKLQIVYIIVGAAAILVFVILLAILAAAYWCRRRRALQDDTLEDPVSPLDHNIQTQQQSRSRRRSQQQGRSRTLRRNYGATAATPQLDQAGNPIYSASSCPESDVTESDGEERHPAHYRQQTRTDGIIKHRKSRPPPLTTLESDGEESEYFSPKPKPTLKKTYSSSGITISVTHAKDYGSTDGPDLEVPSDFFGDTNEQQSPKPKPTLKKTYAVHSTNYTRFDTEGNSDKLSHRQDAFNVSSLVVHVSDSDFNEATIVTASSYGQTTNVSIPFADTVTYGSTGGIYINQMHDITIKIPEKAVPDGAYFQLSVSAMLNGPFLFPEGVRPVSPIIWLCPQPTLTFSKPIEVVLPHYLHCENQADTEHLIFMKANHDPINGKFHFKPADGENTFKHHTSYGTLHTIHCCFLCITEKRTERETPNINFSLITAYPCNPQKRSWSVYFGVTVLLSSCMKTFRKQFKNADYQINNPRIFVMQDTAEKKIKICYQEQLPRQWMAGLSGSDEVLASEVDFWNYTPIELKTMEDEKMYPPRFEVLIDGRSAVGDSMLTVNFSDIKKKLTVKIPLAGAQAKLPDREPITPITDEQDDAIELRELCLELQTVDDWFDLGVYLHIPYSKLKMIEVDYHNIHRRRTEMLQAWLNNFSSSWSAVIEALKLIDMSQLAKRLAAKKKVLLLPIAATQQLDEAGLQSPLASLCPQSDVTDQSEDEEHRDLHI